MTLVSLIYYSPLSLTLDYVDWKVLVVSQPVKSNNHNKKKIPKQKL